MIINQLFCHYSTISQFFDRLNHKNFLLILIKIKVKFYGLCFIKFVNFQIQRSNQIVIQSVIANIDRPSQAQIMQNLQKVRSTFQKEGYAANSFIRRNDYDRLLNSLMRNGEQFDPQVAAQLWTQAADGRQGIPQIRTDEICTTICQGQNILQNKLIEINNEVSSLERQKSQLLNTGQSRQSSMIAKIQQDLQALQEDRVQYEEDLRLLCEPFGISLMGMLVRNSYSAAGNDPTHSAYDPNGYKNSSKVAGDDHEELKWVLYLTLVFCFLQIIMIYGKYDFLNLIVVTILLSIYLLNFFDQVYIKLTLGLLILSVILDFIWLIMYAGPKWSPPKVGNESIYEVGYTRAIVFFTILVILLKLPLGWFLFRYRNASPDNNYTVSVGLLKFYLNSNKSNPISRGINNSLA